MKPYLFLEEMKFPKIFSDFPSLPKRESNQIPKKLEELPSVQELKRKVA